MLFTGEITDAVSKETAGKRNVKITVGLLRNGEQEIKIFGEDGEEPFAKYYYEIGSITKTFTGLLVTKAVLQGRLRLQDSISRYIPELDRAAYYPTVKRLVTHTSGYPPDADEYEPGGRISQINPYMDIGKEELLERIKRIRTEDRDYPWQYSNLGASVAGCVLENIYGTSIDDLMGALLAELELRDTYTLNPIRNLRAVMENGEPGGFWEWKSGSAYRSAGYLVSTAGDMLRYAAIQAEGGRPFVQDSHESLAFVTDEGLRQEMSVFWLLFPQIHAIFHNGGTGCFNCGLCVDLENKNAAVLLSNRYTELDSEVIKWVWKMGAGS